MIEKAPFRAVVIDYCGSCHGKCLTCLLSEDERQMEMPFFTRASLAGPLRKATEALPPMGTFALAFGRANTLQLPEFTIDDIAVSAGVVASHVQCDELIIEVSTSLIGKIDEQIARAMAISKAIVREAPEAHVRFLIVIDPQRIGNDAYWRNIHTFMEEMAAWRGGGDGSGDVMILNVSARVLPDVDQLISRIARYKSTFNVIWIGESDLPASNEAGQMAAALEQWFGDFYRAAKVNEIDSSLVTRADIAMQMAGSIPALSDCEKLIAMHGEVITFIAPDGRLMKGGANPIGDMDPLRYPTLFGHNEVVTNVSRDLFEFLRHPACRACEHTRACIASGVYKFALMNASKLPPEQCPSLMHCVFDQSSMCV